MKLSKATKIFILCTIFCLLCSVFAVGTTRISGQAGAAIDLKVYLSSDLTEAQVPISVANTSWTYGTGANAVNVVYADTTTIGDGNNVTLDLYSSESLLDIFNRDLTITALKLLYIKNNSSNATLEIGGGVSLDLLLFKDTSDVIKIKPGGVFLWIDPSAAGTLLTTNNNLKLTHDGAGSSTMAVDVIAMGLD